MFCVWPRPQTGKSALSEMLDTVLRSIPSRLCRELSCFQKAAYQNLSYQSAVSVGLVFCLWVINPASTVLRNTEPAVRGVGVLGALIAAARNGIMQELADWAAPA